MYTRISRDDIFFFKVLGASFLIHGLAYIWVSV